MALSDVEVVEQTLAAFEANGFARIDPLLEWLADDVELRSAIVGGASGSTYHGHDGVRAWAREVDEAFDDLHLLPHEFQEVGGHVVGLGHVRARGGSSGVVLDVPIAWVLSVRDEKVTMLHGYLTHEAALEAARSGG